MTEAASKEIDPMLFLRTIVILLIADCTFEIT
jgi:hypothetical protein